MMRREEIISAINRTRKSVGQISTLPSKQGIYAFFLAKGVELKEFGLEGGVIYVGLAKKSLDEREARNHLKSGQTGWSSLRRSLGAILKTELDLVAIPRDKTGTRPRPDKYKFPPDGEIKLTDWMKNNLEYGYWENAGEPLSKDDLRQEEEQVIIALQPTLDLDRRTKHLNPLAKDLDELREVCRAEVRKASEIN